MTFVTFMNSGAGRAARIIAGLVYGYESEPRCFDVTIHLPDGLSDDQVMRLTRVADTCPVRRALEAGFAFDERISITRSAVPAGTG